MQNNYKDWNNSECYKAGTRVAGERRRVAGRKETSLPLPQKEQ